LPSFKLFSKKNPSPVIPAPAKNRRQLDPEWIELKPDESLEKCARKICETI
jgi:hypothetical protein